MDTLILATKGCSHGPMLERELQKINVNYRVQYIEDDPDDVIKYQIRNTPNLIVNDSIHLLLTLSITAFSDDFFSS